MKLVIISDTHGMHYQLPWEIPSGDILIHCGDGTINRGRMALMDFLMWFGKLPHKRKVLIAGNHDGVFEDFPDECKRMVLEYAPGTTYLQDSGAEIDGLKFWGSPYTPTFMNWHFMRDRGDAIKRHWDMIPDDTDVLVTHGPPFGYLDKSNNWNEANGEKWDDHLGCRDLRDAMYRVRPELHCFGHIHGSSGTYKYFDDDGHRTILVNASLLDESYDVVNKPKVIEI